MKRLAIALFAGAICISPLATFAQMGGGMASATLRHAEVGVIQSVQGSSFTLSDGRVVFMHQGTVINPTGITLRPGMHVAIRGDRDGHMRFNARVVDRRGTRGYTETMNRIAMAHSTFMGGDGY